jgi:HEPN domain-containing protein
MAVERRVEAYLELAVADLDAAEILARVGNQFAAYHVQQGIEKVIKALLLERGVEAGIEHRLDILADRLPAGDPWHERLEPLLHYSAYATAFRYPTPGGRIVSKPPAGDVLRDVEAVRRFVAQARGTSEA